MSVYVTCIVYMYMCVYTHTCNYVYNELLLRYIRFYVLFEPGARPLAVKAREECRLEGKDHNQSRATKSRPG